MYTPGPRKQKKQINGLQHSLMLFIDSCVFPVVLCHNVFIEEGLRRRAGKSLTLYKRCHFHPLFIVALFFEHFYITFHSGLWFGDLFFTQLWPIMHLFFFKVLHMKHSLSQHICLFSSAAFLLSIDPKMGRQVLSWHRWHSIWFYHMCLRWNSYFAFSLYIYCM